MEHIIRLAVPVLKLWDFYPQSPTFFRILNFQIWYTQHGLLRYLQKVALNFKQSHRNEELC